MKVSSQAGASSRLGGQQAKGTVLEAVQPAGIGGDVWTAGARLDGRRCTCSRPVLVLYGCRCGGDPSLDRDDDEDEDQGDEEDGPAPAIDPYDSPLVSGRFSTPGGNSRGSRGTQGTRPCDSRFSKPRRDCYFAFSRGNTLAGLTAATRSRWKGATRLRPSPVAVALARQVAT